MAAAQTHADNDDDAPVAPAGPPRKHRHDLGQEDHGPKLAAGTTRVIQTLLGMWIALTAALVVYALVDASRTSTVPSVTQPR